MGAEATIDPPEKIAACSYCANGIWYLQAANEAPAVRGPVLTMFWGVQSSQQVIVAIMHA
eukprot:scaffold47562_cov61-Cyclotella_meneghiniana.AAC.2